MQKAHKYTENSIKHELHNRNIKTQSSQHNKNTENERKNKKGSYRTVIPAVLCKHILFSRCCLSPFFKLYFYWVHKGSEERINLINEISPSLSNTLWPSFTLQKSPLLTFLPTHCYTHSEATTHFPSWSVPPCLPHPYHTIPPFQFPTAFVFVFFGFLPSQSSSFSSAHLHTVITDAAVGAAWRSVEMAGRAPLHPHLDALHVHVLVQRSAELIILVFILAGWETRCEVAKIKLPNKLVI